MGVYKNSEGALVDTKSLNSFNLVNGLIKAVRENSELNVAALKAEMLERLDTRPKAE